METTPATSARRLTEVFLHTLVLLVAVAGAAFAIAIAITVLILATDLVMLSFAIEKLRQLGGS